LGRFDGVKAQVLGLSVDSVPCLQAWSESLGNITYPLLSDFYPHGRVAQAYGVLRSEGYAERAIFVIDKRGVIRYIDVHAIDDQPDNEVLFGVLSELEPGAAPASRPAEPRPEPEADVVLYCTPWCPDCRRARAFFAKYEIPYQEIDIQRDRAAAERVRDWANGYETTPAFQVYGQVIVGFDQARLAKALGIQLRP